jgi:Asp-tRNA(Asn)/Glu-tRNA(Gln) amidotransferase A subunit family amidase
MSKKITVAESGALIHLMKLEPTGSGLLDGLSFGVKDLIDIQGYVTGCGNPDWARQHPPAPANAVCVDQMLASGASCIGKTVSDELAFSLDGKNVFYGTFSKPTLGPRTSKNLELARNLDRRRIGLSVRRAEAYRRRLNTFLKPHDILCLPTTPALAPVKGTLGDNARTSRAQFSYYPRTLSLTSIAGIGRLPQTTLPLGDVAGVPVGGISDCRLRSRRFPAQDRRIVGRNSMTGGCRISTPERDANA